MPICVNDDTGNVTADRDQRQQLAVNVPRFGFGTTSNGPAQQFCGLRDQDVCGVHVALLHLSVCIIPVYGPLPAAG